MSNKEEYGGWAGIKVRHADGRTGVIRSDYTGFAHRALTIEIDGGGKDHVQLNADGPDSGSKGWEWWCEHFSSGPCWLKLGDHSD